MNDIITPEQLLRLASIMALLMFSAFFSGSETALTAASRARMHALSKDGDKRAKIVSRLLEARERLIGALLLGNNLVNILASALMTALALEIFGEFGVVYATLVMTLLVLIFAEVLPKTYAITRPDSASLTVARPVSLVVWLFAPIVRSIQVLVNSVLRLFGVGGADGVLTPADEIRGAIDLHHKEGSVQKHERDQILGVLNIGDLSVEEVMIHRKNLVMIDADLPLKEIIDIVLSSGHSRIPIWQNEKDNVIGVLHAKDLLKALAKSGGKADNIKINKLLRKPWFVPETTPVLTQLKAFQNKRAHFALVVDEYGALMGVVTLEDIIEEIVGDIKDEHDYGLGGVKQQKDGSVIASGDVPVRDLNRLMDWELSDEEAVTIAGLIIHEAEAIPNKGQEFSFNGYRFKVLGKSKNQITKVKIKKEHEA